MNRIAKAAAHLGMAVLFVGMAACAPLQNPYATSAIPAGSSTLGSSNSYPSNSYSSSASASSNSGTVAGGTIDSARSQALSDYLKHHQLPLVGGQVVSSPTGGRQVILFGFVASDYGKTDAAQKARNYLKDPNVVVDNRIKVSPELAGAKSGASAAASSTSNSSPDASDPYAESGSIQDYQNNMPPDAQVYQQQQYQQYGGGSSAGMITTIIPLIGMLGGFSTGGSGGSFGGFSSGYAPGYGGYGYPTYPPPAPSSGFGPPSYPYP